MTADADQTTGALDRHRVGGDLLPALGFGRHPAAVTQLFADDAGWHEMAEFGVVLRASVDDEIEQGGRRAISDHDGRCVAGAALREKSHDILAQRRDGDAMLVARKTIDCMGEVQHHVAHAEILGCFHHILALRAVADHIALNVARAIMVAIAG